MSDTLEIPEPIRKAAIAIDVFFKVNGVEEWALMGIQSRRSEPVPAPTQDAEMPWSTLEKELATERAARERAEARLKDAELPTLEHVQAIYAIYREKARVESAESELAALKLKLEVAKEALQGIVDHCIHPDVAVRAVMVDLKPIREAISKLNAP